ncbi:ATP-binding protein [Desulfobacterales bacterium HSG2]|nr:ATP-binding protein [Desulfobacterales bacterium HSG2]
MITGSVFGIADHSYRPSSSVNDGNLCLNGLEAIRIAFVSRRTEPTDYMGPGPVTQTGPGDFLSGGPKREAHRIRQQFVGRLKGRTKKKQEPKVKPLEHDAHSSTINSEDLTDGLVTGSGKNSHDTGTGRGSFPSEPKASDSSQAPDLKAIKTIFIEQLRLRNFCSYPDACLTFEDFTILIGQNGAGKSTLREALEIMRDALTDSLSNALSRRGGLEYWIRQGGKESEKNLSLAIQLRFGARDDRLRAVYGFDLLLTEGGGYRIFQEHLTFSTDQVPHFHREGDQFQTSLPLPELPLAPDQLAFPLLAGSHPFWKACLNEIRGVSAYIFSPERMRQETTALNQSRLASDGQNAANILEGLENHRGVIKMLTERLCAVIPGIHRVFTESFRGRRILGFEQDGERMVRLDATQVSDGTLRILGILLAICQQPPPTLIFLEELEDSVHPEAFATITEAIEEAAEQTQIVITSHSPVALMHKPVTEARTRLIRWELGRSEIYKLESPPPEEEDYPFSVGEMLQFNAITPIPLPSSVKGGFFEADTE